MKGAPKSGPQGTLTPCEMRREDCRLRLRMVLDHNKASLAGAVKTIMKLARKAGYSDDEQTDLEIALTEALANALIHGNEEGPGKSIFVRAYAAPKQGLMIAVRDEGQGFDPEGVPDPRSKDRMHLHHGRGVFLMRQLMDLCVYRKRGTEVVLYKSLA